MSMQTFDPYHHWLGIPPHEQPPNYYRLVGAALFEPNPAVIAAAADRWLTFLSGMSRTEYAGHAHKLYQEIAYAKMYLCHPQQKAAYDAWLQQMAANGSSITGGSTISAAGGSSITSQGRLPPVAPTASSIQPPAAPAAPNYANGYGSTGYTAIPTIPSAPGAPAAMPSAPAVPAAPYVPQAPAGYGQYSAPAAAAPAAPVAPALNLDTEKSVNKPAAKPGAPADAGKPTPVAPPSGFNPILFAAVGGSLVAVGVIVMTVANAKPTKVVKNDAPEKPAATAEVLKPRDADKPAVATEGTPAAKPATPPKFTVPDPNKVAPVEPVPAVVPEAATEEMPGKAPGEEPAEEPAADPETTPKPEMPAETETPGDPADPVPPIKKPGKTEGMDEEPAPGPETPGEEMPADAPNKTARTPGNPPAMEEEPAEKPAAATPEQEAQFKRFMKAARTALSERELNTAEAELKKAKEFAVTEEQEEALYRGQQMHSALKQMWDGVTQQIAILKATQELTVKNKNIIIVSVGEGRMRVKSSGKEYNWDVKSMPTSVARVLCEMWFANSDTEAMRNWMLGTHYLLDKEGSDVFEARSLWQRAASDPQVKPVVDALQPEL